MKTDLGREPSDEELADITGIALPRVIKVRKRMRSRVPFSVAEGEDDDENSGTDVAVSRRTPYDDWVDAVYHDLGEIDKIILQHRSGYRGAEILPNQEIAKKLGLSPAAVSQKAARIQARLDEFNG
jgi:RNA polymerase primary sigma factor